MVRKTIVEDVKEKRELDDVARGYYEENARGGTVPQSRKRKYWVYNDKTTYGYVNCQATYNDARSKVHRPKVYMNQDGWTYERRAAVADARDYRITPYAESSLRSDATLYYTTTDSEAHSFGEPIYNSSDYLDVTRLSAAGYDLELGQDENAEDEYEMPVVRMPVPRALPPATGARPKQKKRKIGFGKNKKK